MLPEANGSRYASSLSFENRLIETLGARRYQNWFAGKTRFDLSDDQLTIFASSPYLASWLQRQFAATVQELVSTTIGGDIRVEWSIDATLSAATLVAASKAGEAAASVMRAVQPTRHTKDAAPAGPARRVYELDAFVQGACNEMAVLAARQVIENPGLRLNPLYLFGPVGTGKTHLLEAIGAELRRNGTSRRVLSMTAEAFANAYTQAIETRTLVSFRQKLRAVDVLLIDDVDFLDGRNGLQDEFLHTVQKLEEGGKQLILTADRHPRLLTKTSEELVTRFQAGLATRLEAPDQETRLTIARRLATTMNIPIADDAVELVANRFRNNVRELEGAFNCLRTWHAMTQRRITQNCAREVLSRLERDCRRIVRMADVETVVCEFFGVAPDELRSDNKSRSLVQPRMLAMYLSRRLTRRAYSEIGGYFGGRKHTTAIAAEKRIDEQVEGRETVRIGAETWTMHDLVENLTRQIQAG
jgi:chromosomal replication initiator protein